MRPGAAQPASTHADPAMEAGKGRRVRGQSAETEGAGRSEVTLGESKRLRGKVQQLSLFLASLRDIWGRTGPWYKAGVLAAAGGFCISHPDSSGCVHCVLALFTDPSPDQAEAPQAG